MAGGLQKRGVELVAEGSASFFGTLKDADKAVTSFGDATGKAGGKVSAAGEIMIGALRHVGTIAVEVGAAAARAIGSFVSDAVSQAGDFESGMLRFGSVTGDAIADAGMELEDFSALFLQLGADTQFSAAQAQEAAINLAKGGLTPAMIAGGALADTLTLAAAGELDLAKAADITAKQLGVWADQGVTSAQVADLLAQSANASVVSVEELALGMANVGGVAKLAGASFQDTVTALGAVSAGFSSAADAGTSMKAFLMKLQPTTKPAILAFKELNLLTAEGKSAFYDAAGNFVGFSKAAELLKGSLQGLTKADQERNLQMIFGADGIRVAALLAEKGAAGFDAFAASMGATGSASEQAAAKNQGFNFALETMMGSLDTLKVVLGTAILPLLTSFITNGLTPAINAVMAFTGTFAKLIPTILASNDPINTFFNALRVAAPDAVPQINAVQNAFDSIVGPINTAKDALVTFGQTEWGQSIQRGGQVVSDYFAGPFQTDITNGLNVVQQALTDFGASPWGTELQQGAGVVAAYFANDFPGELSRGITVVQEALTVLGASPWATGLQSGASTTAAYFANDFPGELQRGTTIVMTELDKLAASPWYTEFIRVSATVTAYMVNDFPTELARGTSLVITTLDELAASPWYTEFIRVSSVVTDFMTTPFPTLIASGVDTALAAVKGFVDDFKTAGTALVSGIIAGVQGAAGELAGAVGRVISGAVEAAKNALASGSPSRVTEEEIGVPFVQGIAVGIAGGAGELQTLAAGLGTTMVDAAAGIVSGIKKTTVDIGTAISSGFAKKTDDATEAGTDISSGLAQGISDGKSEAISAAIQVATSAIDAAKSALGISSPSEETKKRVGTPFVQGIIAGLEAEQAAADKAAMNLATGMIGAARGTLEKTGNLATLIGGGGEAKSTALNASWQGLSNDLLSVKDAALLANSAMGYMESGLLKVNLSGRETAKQIKIMTEATIRATRGMQGKTVANLLEARTEEKVTAQTRLLELQTEKAITTFLKINPQIDAAGVKSLVMAGKLDEATGKLILMEQEARLAESALGAFEQLMKDAEQAAKDTAAAIDDAATSFRAFTQMSVADTVTGFADRQRQIAEGNRTIAQLRGDTNVRDLQASLDGETQALADAKDKQVKLEAAYQLERAAILATTDFEQDYVLDGELYQGRISRLAALDAQYADDRTQAANAITAAITAQTAAQVALAAEQARVASNAAAANRAQQALNAAIAESDAARRVDEQAGNDLLALRVQQINELLGLESERADLQAQVAGGNEAAAFERDAVDAQIAAIKLAQEHDINALLATARERIMADLAAANNIDAELAATTPALIARVQEIMNALTAAAQSSLGIHSPSAVAQGAIGEPFGKGILLGISDVINTQLPALLAGSMSAMAMVMPPAPTIRPPSSAPGGGRSYTDASSSTNNTTINGAGMSEARLEAMITRVINRTTGRANGIKATGGYS